MYIYKAGMFFHHFLTGRTREMIVGKECWNGGCGGDRAMWMIFLLRRLKSHAVLTAMVLNKVADRCGFAADGRLSSRDLDTVPSAVQRDPRIRCGWGRRPLLLVPEQHKVLQVGRGAACTRRELEQHLLLRLLLRRDGSVLVLARFRAVELRVILQDQSAISAEIGARSVIRIFTTSPSMRLSQMMHHDKSIV